MSALFGFGNAPARPKAATLQRPAPVVNSPSIPPDVAIPAGFAGNPIAFFDDYSWRTFLAVVWPAKDGMRGEPDTAKQLDGEGPRVFETYKSLWEVFHADGSDPIEWNRYDDKQFNACAEAPAFGDIELASFSKFSDIGQASFGRLAGPLVAQNRTYVRYLTGFNQPEFNSISSNRWFLRANITSPANPITFPNGSIDVKSAWVDMTGIAHPERYYTRQASVMDPETGVCSKKLVGLIGLHIVQKTPSRPQWIWSSFEQVDNVPSDPMPPAGSKFTLHDGTATSMPPRNPYPSQPLPLPTPAPFNVQRLLPIHDSTAQTNLDYQAAIRAHMPNSKWQFYKLVMTQWPTTPNNPTLPGDPAHTFPGTGSDTTAFANTALETFEQTRIITGCMACHNVTGKQTDFLWTLKDHAFPPTIPALMRDQSNRKLNDLLRGDQGAIEEFRRDHPQRAGGHQ